VAGVTAKKLRDVQRVVHFIAAAVVLAYIYTPLNDNPISGVMVKVMAVPMLVGSGLLMWQMPRLRRWRRARQATAEA
jgi:thiosulfate reductase cytochrome b subunit